MHNSNVIGIYSTVICDPTTQWRFETPFTEDTTLVDGELCPIQTMPVTPIKMRKLVLNVGADSERRLQRKYPNLYPHLNIHEMQTLGSQPCVKADVCVHLDPLFTEVLDLQVEIAVQAANYETAKAYDKVAELHAATSGYKELAEAYSVRVNDFNKLSLWRKLLHVVTSWYNEQKAV